MTAVLQSPEKDTTTYQPTSREDDSQCESAIYIGTVVHRRHSPVAHEFKNRLFLASIDVDQTADVFRVPLLCSTSLFSVARFRRADYFGDPNRPLGDCIRELVLDRTGIALGGRIQLLTHLRYFGFVFNPVSFYYCFDSAGNKLQAVVADVTNTPWGERHCYVIPCETDRRVHDFECIKQFHVSPFMPMAVSYAWRFTTPDDHLAVRIENHDESGCVFDVTLQMERTNLTTARLMWAIARFPFMTVRVVLSIYWQALRLWSKKVPFIPHPRRAT